MTVFLLFLILIMLAILVAILSDQRTRYKNSNNEKNQNYNKYQYEKETNNSSLGTFSSTPGTFTKKDYLLTPTELKFYKVLKPIADELNMNLFCQVSMYEVVRCKDYGEFNRIKSKCIDFVVTERNCKIRLCIELDDPTHNSYNRKDRDKLIDNIFKDAGVNFTRIKTQNYYNVQQLRNLIVQCMYE